MEASQEGVNRTLVLESMVRSSAQGVTYVTAREIAEDIQRSKVSVHRVLNSLRARGLVDFLEPHQITGERTRQAGRPSGMWFLMPGFEGNATALNQALALSDEAMRLVHRAIKQIGQGAPMLKKAGALLSARDPEAVESVTYPSQTDAELIVSAAAKLTKLVARFAEIENSESEEG